MSIKELFEYLTSTPLTPYDTKLFLIGACESEFYLNAITNMTAQDIAQYIFALYEQNPTVHEALDTVRMMVDAKMRREMDNPRGEVANTVADDANAVKAIRDAMDELGAIYIGDLDNKIKS